MFCTRSSCSCALISSNFSWNSSSAKDLAILNCSLFNQPGTLDKVSPTDNVEAQTLWGISFSSSVTLKSPSSPLSYFLANLNKLDIPSMGFANDEPKEPTSKTCSIVLGVSDASGALGVTVASTLSTTPFWKSCSAFLISFLLMLFLDK